MTAPGPRLLIVEDDDAARHALATYLRKREYRVEEAATAVDALRAWGGQRPDVMLLDLGLPDLDGVEVIHRIRREAATPIIVLSGRGEERDRIAGLEAGADDYLGKPFAVDELNARIRALLRRAGGPGVDASGCLRLGPVELDPTRREVRAAGNLVRLTPREYELLKVLLANQGRVVTRERVLRAVWGQAYTDATQYVHVYVGRLRRKLADAGAGPAVERLFTTEPGIGYRVADAETLREAEG
jgi:two-component system KDP operon response regulator KdpE